MSDRTLSIDEKPKAIRAAEDYVAEAGRDGWTVEGVVEVYLAALPQPSADRVQAVAKAIEPLLPGAYFSTCEKVATAAIAAMPPVEVPWQQVAGTILEACDTLDGEETGLLLKVLYDAGYRIVKGDSQ